METNLIAQELTGTTSFPQHQYQPNTWETKRLFLRPFTAQDFPYLYRVYGDAEVMRFIGKGARTELETLSELISFINHWQQHNFGNFAIIHKASGKLIGRTGIYLSDRCKEAQFGYVFDKNYWGQGLGTEAAKASLDYGFKVLEFEQIIAFSMPENVVSRKILSEKLGMHCITDNFRYSGIKYAYYSIGRVEYLTTHCGKKPGF
jgi:[ribosomal protein S5]-alanine N-acetyltransferase